MDGPFAQDPDVDAFLASLLPLPLPDGAPAQSPDSEWNTQEPSRVDEDIENGSEDEVECVLIHEGEAVLAKKSLVSSIFASSSACQHHFALTLPLTFRHFFIFPVLNGNVCSLRHWLPGP